MLADDFTQFAEIDQSRRIQHRQCGERLMWSGVPPWMRLGLRASAENHRTINEGSTITRSLDNRHGGIPDQIGPHRRAGLRTAHQLQRIASPIARLIDRCVPPQWIHGSQAAETRRPPGRHRSRPPPSAVLKQAPQHKPPDRPVPPLPPMPRRAAAGLLHQVTIQPRIPWA